MLAVGVIRDEQTDGHGHGQTTYSRIRMDGDDDHIDAVKGIMIG